MGLIFVDCEADGPCPELGVLTEFGAVDYDSRKTFHGKIWEAIPNPENPARSIRRGKQIDSPHNVFTQFSFWIREITKGRPIFVSDNPAYDFQWINHGFWTTIGENPFGHSGRRISDFYAGLMGNFSKTQNWKRLRITPHDHNPVNDALGNVEAFERLLRGER